MTQNLPRNECANLANRRVYPTFKASALTCRVGEKLRTRRRLGAKMSRKMSCSR